MSYKDVEKKYIERTWEPISYDFAEIWYVPCFQRNPDDSEKDKNGKVDNFPGYPNFSMEFGMATTDEQMAWASGADYVLELTGHFKTSTKPFVKKIFIEEETKPSNSTES